MNHCFTHITVAFPLRKGCIPATAACNKSRPASAGRALPGGNKHNAAPEALAKGVGTRLGWDSNGKIIETNQLTIKKQDFMGFSGNTIYRTIKHGYQLFFGAAKL